MFKKYSFFKVVMFEYVTADEFTKKMTSGKTAPFLLNCSRPDGSDIDVITKYSVGCEMGVHNLVNEAIAAMLAADLCLPVPEPFAVQFDQEFIDTVYFIDPQLADRLKQSVPVAFGSTQLNGYSLVVSDSINTESSRQEAAEIFAFDSIVVNPDRSYKNPNCLFNGKNFAIIDHELCFLQEQTLFWEPPWIQGSLTNMKNHVFYSALYGKHINLSRFSGAWNEISDIRLNQYRQALPPEWTIQQNKVDNILNYVAQVRDNIRLVVAEVLRVLSCQ